ncbi:MAG: hypothetical protein Q8S53_08420 [Brevundimonas sp.]|uniref:hypothetical protein n=1 Tax=Brevundimonas sp. TaxID=1871086 RepID=UPI0027355FAD|nr:hypothetical protein [Brevundimonas sp.]MDP3378375.1 hypothetical protein [Brevundimonas sp.]
MRTLIPLVLALVLTGCVTAMPDEPAGPDAAALSALLAVGRAEAPELRGVRCAFIAEEGSEWVCAYEERARAGAWVGLSTVVALSGTDWVLIDGTCSADEALADRGRCRR